MLCKEDSNTTHVSRFLLDEDLIMNDTELGRNAQIMTIRDRIHVLKRKNTN
jgi:hypothetical protein